jgi:ABC-2 type transport system permease protein
MTTTTSYGRRLPGDLETARIVGGVVLRALTTRGRIVALTLLGAAVVLVGWAVGLGIEDEAERLDTGFDILSTLGLAVIVPFVALVYGSACLGDLRDDRTLVYLWLRPLRRWPIVIGAVVAALVLVVPLTVVPVTFTAALAGGSELAVPALVASLLGALTYTSIFTALGLMVRRSLVWGLGYILIWEGFVANGGAGVARLAVRSYTRTVAARLADVDADLPVEMPLGIAVAVPLVVIVVALVVTSRRLARMDVD